MLDTKQIGGRQMSIFPLTFLLPWETSVSRGKITADPASNHTRLGHFHLLQPAIVIKNLKLHQNSGQLVEVADNFGRLRSF